MGLIQPAECAEEVRFSKDVPAEQRRYRNKTHKEIVAEKCLSWIKSVKSADSRGFTNPKSKKQMEGRFVMHHHQMSPKRRARNKRRGEKSE